MHSRKRTHFLLIAVVALLLAAIAGQSGAISGQAGTEHLPVILRAGASQPVDPTATPDPTGEPTQTPTATADPCTPQPGNLLSNAGFEAGTEGWSFSGGRSSTLTAEEPAFRCTLAAKVVAGSGGSTQLFQHGISLKPATRYRLHFAARASAGDEVRVDLLKHGRPYTNYGLRERVNLTPEWQTFEFEFTTTGFGSPVSNGRFRFYLPRAQAGNVYWFDDVMLEEVTGDGTATPPPPPSATPTAAPPTATPTAAPPTPTPQGEPPRIIGFTAQPATINRGDSATLSWEVEGQVTNLRINNGVGNVTGKSSVEVTPDATTTYRLEATNSAGTSTATVTVTVNSGGGGDTEMIVYDWNGLVTEAEHGFPRDTPPMESANGNWTQPVNFAEGTFYYRVEIRSQPEPQDMLLQFCVWQDNHTLENCGPKEAVRGTRGNVVTWSGKLEDMWMKNGNPIDWSRPRQRWGVAIKNKEGKPVSDLKDWNWNGEDPKKWYPIDWRFTVVVVAKGATFSGWDYWLNQ